MFMGLTDFALELLCYFSLEIFIAQWCTRLARLSDLTYYICIDIYCTQGLVRCKCSSPRSWTPIDLICIAHGVRPYIGPTPTQLDIGAYSLC